MSNPHTREATVSPAVEGPADEYFNSHSYESWDIIDYSKQFGKLDTRDRLLNSWWKSLHWRGLFTSPAATKASDLMRAKPDISPTRASYDLRVLMVLRVRLAWWGLCSLLTLSRPPPPPFKDKDRSRARAFFSQRNSPGVHKVIFGNLSNVDGCSFHINTASPSLDTPPPPPPPPPTTTTATTATTTTTTTTTTTARPLLKRKTATSLASQPPKKRATPTKKSLKRIEQKKRLSLFQKRLDGLESPWTLNPQNPSVEYRLGQYVAGNNLHESPAHSFVLDTSDPVLMELFDDDEVETIMGLVQELPEPDSVLRDYLNMFLNIETIDNFKDILEQGAFVSLPTTSALSNCERRRDYPSLEWAHLVLSSLICDYKTGHIALSDNREKWYQTHVWALLFDRLFEYIPQIRFLGGECPTNATSSRKNPKNRSPGTRKVSGCLHDGVIKFWDYEIGAVENRGCNVKPDGAKWNSDSLKLVKSNRDMIVEILKLLGPEGNRVSTLGLLTGGLKFESLRLIYGGGSVCVLVRDEANKLSTSIQHFGPIADAMLHIWRIKSITEQSTKALTRLLNRASGRRQPSAPALLGSIDTDPPTYVIDSEFSDDDDDDDDDNDDDDNDNNDDARDNDIQDLPRKEAVQSR
ncbi:hypothetical protein DFP73DRAFT_621615 [Morchella snyderi]|nr:hypothetical protein DFP73DRAFT_621615 [Morchella snyderi]